MIKKVLIISSSPRKGGNSDILCDEFYKGAKERGHVVKKIFLRDKEINYCTGCGFCSSNDYQGCAKHDDMAEILNDIINSDVIVLSTPIYFYSVSGQMKVFIDRICARYTHIENKEFYYILTAADSSTNAVQYALGDLKGLVSCLKGSHEKGYIFAGGVWGKGEVKDKKKYLQQAFELGKEV